MDLVVTTRRRLEEGRGAKAAPLDSKERIVRRDKENFMVGIYNSVGAMTILFVLCSK
jgi:hypothetical protein